MSDPVDIDVAHVYRAEDDWYTVYRLDGPTWPECTTIGSFHRHVGHGYEYLTADDAASIVIGHARTKAAAARAILLAHYRG